MSQYGSSDVYNITVTQGDTLSRVLTWTTNAKVPYNLTGYTAKMQVRSSANSDVVVLELSTTNTYIVLGGVAGTITLNLPAANMSVINAGQYVYDLELVSGGGQKTTIVEGNFKVKAQVTR
jgi:hypothetical protein